jgi:hypothetical protein
MKQVIDSRKGQKNIACVFTLERHFQQKLDPRAFIIRSFTVCTVEKEKISSYTGID